MEPCSHAYPDASFCIKCGEPHPNLVWWLTFDSRSAGGIIQAMKVGETVSMFSRDLTVAQVMRVGSAVAASVASAPELWRGVIEDRLIDFAVERARDMGMSDTSRAIRESGYPPAE